jgi:hypothetical protein
MSKPRFTVTYEIITPESAARCDVAEHGYVQPGGWHFDSTDLDEVSMDLRSAVALVDTLEDAGRWFVECDGRVDYVTGAEERRALHPPRSITPASYRRLARLLGCG